MTASNPNLSGRNRFVSLLGTGIVLTLATGIVYGRLTQRWGPVPDLVEAAKHLESFPTNVGDWQLLSEEEMSDSTVRMLSCAGHINRKYVDRNSGRTISIAVMVGPPGPIAVHTPEICYSSRAYKIQQPRKKIHLPDSAGVKHSFWSLSFRPNKDAAHQLRVYYAWSTNGDWSASASPRYQFAAKPFLFKLQMASDLPSAADADSSDACRDFLQKLLDSGWRVSS